MINIIKIITFNLNNMTDIAIRRKRLKKFHAVTFGKEDCFVVSLPAMTNWLITIRVIIGVLILACCSMAGEITKTFIQGENGYDGYESVTIANAGHVEKTPLNWWPNNALNRKNDIAADVSEFRC